MVKYKFSNEDPGRQKLLQQLASILKPFLETYSDSHVSNEELKNHPIDISSLSLSNDGSNMQQKGCYFSPLDVKLVDSAMSEYEMKQEWPQWTFLCNENFDAAGRLSHFIDHFLAFSGLKGEKWLSRRRRYGFESYLYECHRPTMNQWCVPWVLEALDEGLPHVGAIQLEMTSMDERIFRSELITLLCLMLQKLHNTNGFCHQIVPVLLISYSGFQARVLQASFESGRLEIQKSDPIQFENGEKMDKLKTLLQWICWQPQGKTRWPRPIKDPLHPGRLIDVNAETASS